MSLAVHHKITSRMLLLQICIYVPYGKKTYVKDLDRWFIAVISTDDIDLLQRFIFHISTFIVFHFFRPIMTIFYLNV